jgi:hypothetical protein
MRKFKLSPDGLLDYGEYEKTREDYTAYTWCINNGIIVYEEVKKEEPWHVFIKIGNKLHKSPDTYGKGEVTAKVFEYYKYYYNKNKNEQS